MTFLHLLGWIPRAAVINFENSGDEDNRNLFFHNSRGRKSQIKVSQSCSPGRGSGGEFVPCIF